MVIAEPSLIIRKGLLSVLKKLSTLHIETAEVADMQQLMTSLSWHRPDILIVNPGVAGVVSLAQIKRGAKERSRNASHCKIRWSIFLS